MPARTRTPITLISLALLLSGCGSAGAPVRTRDTSFTVTVGDYYLRPQQLRVPKGQRLTVTVVNRGRVGHTFRIRSANHTVLAITTIRPGERSEPRSFRLAPGNYTMFCALANHEELGVNGKLTVG